MLLRMRNAVLAATLLVLPLSAFATKITIVNADDPGEGFNDPTPLAPVGGNSGTTLGEQRLLLFQRVADKWASIINSNVEIVVKASFDPLECDSTSGVLGSAGPVQIFSDFAGAPIPGTWYPVALANKLAGRDLAPPPGSADDPPEDIRAKFNSTVGSSTCLRGRNFYYGFDDAPGGKIDLYVVLLHELGHGLGFINIVDETTGAFCCSDAGMVIPDIASWFTLDTTTGLHWAQMSDTQRVASATNTGNLVWDGASAIFGAGETLAGPNVITFDSPESLKGSIDAGKALFGPALTVSGVAGTVVQALDAADSSGPSTTDGCSALSNPGEVRGRIALVDRGTCTFLQKATNIQQAGAIGIIIANDQAGDPFTVGPGDFTITIPIVSVTQADGAKIRSALPAGVSGVLHLDPTRLSGADSMGRVRLYAPNPVESGSSISHWDKSASPNLLMEPIISADLTHDVDITRNYFVDIGWFAAPQVKASNRAALLVDRDGDGLPDPGDTIRYLVTISNSGDVVAAALRYVTSIDPNAQLVAGSAIVSAGSVSLAGNELRADVGTLAGRTSATLTFDVVISPTLPTSVTSINNQGTASGSNFASVQSSDPAVSDQPAPTTVAISHTPMRALMKARVALDADASRGLSRGDTLEYTVTVTNWGAADATAVVFTDEPDANTSLVAGSVVVSQGSVTRGNAAGDASVLATMGTIPAGRTATVTFRAQVRNSTPAGVVSVSNQGSVTGDGFSATPTDDPNVSGANDPTRSFFAMGRRHLRRR